MLACTCKIVGVEDALVVRSSCGASWSALEKDLVLVIRIVIGLALDCGAGLGSLCRFGCSGSGALSSGRFDFYLVDGQMVLILAVFTSNSIAELFSFPFLCSGSSLAWTHGVAMVKGNSVSLFSGP